MCGIFGVLQKELSPDQWETLLCAGSDRMVHRGPDDAGLWCQPSDGIGFAFRRLSILDLSVLGHQPMASASVRYYIVFNGEIYNFQPLRDELLTLGHHFRGHSDTEVLLAAIEQWDLEPTLQRLNGMFAFALWDAQQKQLHLVRDRLGIKPLYYGCIGSALVFASELKAMKAHPAFAGDINRDALALYLRHNYIPAPYSIFKGIYKLPPGTILTVDQGNDLVNLAPTPFWSAHSFAQLGILDPYAGSPGDALVALDSLLRDAVRSRMIADVPLGAFLSGGIDSSIVVSLMQAQSARPVKTFSIGFEEEGYDEASYARAVAQHLGTDHTELYVTPAQARDVIPKLPELYDEPFADSSQIPTFLVSELARAHVTVSLSGDGGDELFAGYDRYYFARDVWSKVDWMPSFGRHALSRFLTIIPKNAFNHITNRMPPLFTGYGRPGLAGDKIYKFAEVLAHADEIEFYRHIVSHWKNPATLAIGAQEPQTPFTNLAERPAFTDLVDRMMYLDLVTYLPDDILVKVDRASMGVSLEVRVPLLDHRVVEFALRLPLCLKVQNGQGKWLLKQLLSQYVPSGLIERPKMGFGVPIGDWLRAPLRDWTENLLDERRMHNEGYFAPNPIRRRWQQHLTGQADWSAYLWDVLMFQAWLEQNGSC